MSDTDQRGREWPREYFTCEVVAFWNACKVAKGNGTTREQLWFQHFPDAEDTHFPQQHSDHHRKCCEAAPSQLRSEFLRAGCSHDGLWSNFMMKQLNPSRKCDAARKQLNRVAHQELLQKEEKRTSTQKAPSGDEDDEEIDIDYDCLDV
jgi:hypothetical protein